MDDVLRTEARSERLDATVADLRSGLPDWVGLPPAERIGLLRESRRRLGQEAPGMVAAMRDAQGLPDRGPWAAEPWDVLLATALCVRAAEFAMRRLSASGDGLPGRAVRTHPDGRVVVDVFPQRWDERLLLSDYHGELWMPAGMPAARVRAEAGWAYRDGGFERPGVALLLGAGNVVMPTVSDLLHLLCGQGCTVAVKMNPVLGYLRPMLEHVFGEFIDRNWLRFVDDTNEVGQYLAHHDGVDRVHMTGSAATYDGFVWGFDDRAEQRRAADTPVLDKPFTAELGGVNPHIVVPGPWSARDLLRQADRIVFAKLLNAGHVCAAPQVLMLPDEWDRTDPLLDLVRTLMRRVQPRAPYYPGTETKVRRALADQAHVEVLQPPDRRLLVTADVARDATLFREEVFSDVLAVVRLPAPSLGSFLHEAVRFANDRLAGSLAATVLVDPATARQHRAALGAAVAKLRYGVIGINEWAQISAVLGYTTWGAYPGHTRQSIGSGIGRTINALGLPTPEKSVVTGRFHPPIKSPFSVTNRTADVTIRRFVSYATTDDVRMVPGIVTSAVRG